MRGALLCAPLNQFGRCDSNGYIAGALSDALTTWVTRPDSGIHTRRTGWISMKGALLCAPIDQSGRCDSNRCPHLLAGMQC